MSNFSVNGCETQRSVALAMHISAPCCFRRSSTARAPGFGWIMSAYFCFIPMRTCCIADSFPRSCGVKLPYHQPMLSAIVPSRSNM